MSRMKVALTISVALLGLLGPVVGSVSAQVVRTRSGPINKFAGTDVIGSQDCTSETAFQQIPHMRQKFTIPGSSNTEVVVLFQGTWEAFNLAANTSDNAKIRLRIDGQVQGGPGQGVFVYRLLPAFGSNDATHGYQFISNALSPGEHTARIDFAVNSGEGTVCVREQSMIVMHK